MIPFLDAALRSVHKQSYDDAVDRMSYYYSTLILLFLSILTTAKQYVGNPIQCWVPAQFRGGWEQYAENYCFIQNTYYVPFDKNIPKDVVERDYRKIGYYQWVPIILAVQALLFYMPNWFWKLFNWQSGINVKSILKLATTADVPDETPRKSMVKILARHVQQALVLEKISTKIYKPPNPYVRPSSDYSCSLGRKSNAFLTYLYLLTKLLYVVNVVGQFFLLNTFLGTNYKFWGWQIFLDLVNGREWTVSGHFPRVTYCDFNVREMGENIHNHSVQCVLMINMFNEKIFLFLWFWMLLVAICSMANFFYWLFFNLPRNSRKRLVHKFLQIAGAANFDGCDFTDAIPGNAVAWQNFATEGLRMDGVLLLRFISTHVGDLIAAELTVQLFTDYCARGRNCRVEKMHAAQKLGNGLHPHPELVPLNAGFSECLDDSSDKPPSSQTDGSTDSSATCRPTDDANGKNAANGYPGPPKGIYAA